jgi:YHS domain-containing protein
MKEHSLPIVLLSALALVLVMGVFAQQKADTAIDPVCGMTVVKANARATYEYKGTTYYFCNPGCKDAFAKDPEKYLKAPQAKAEPTPAAAPAAPMAHMGRMGMMRHGRDMGMGTCPMMQGGRMGGRMGMMPRRMGPMAGPMGPVFRLYGDKVEVAVENTKDGAALKITSKDPEVVKAIQVHMAEHIAMMKKMKEAQAKIGTGAGAAAESACCAECPMVKK